MSNASLSKAAIAVLALFVFGSLPAKAIPQDPPKSAAEMVAATQADLHGQADDLYGSDMVARWMAAHETPANAIMEALQLPSPPQQPRAAAGTVSVSSLKHHIPKAARKPIERGQRLSKSGDYAAAAKEFEKALAVDPDNADVLNNLGAQYFRLGRYAEAELRLKRSIELDPSSSIAHSNLSVLQLALGNRVLAEGEARRALELSASNARARLVLGVILAGNPATRTEGLQNLQYASHSIPAAEALLKSIREK